MSFLRQSATTKFPLSSALSAYLKDHGGEPPAKVEELAPYFTPPIEPAILQRYDILPPDQRTMTIRAGVTTFTGNYLIGEKGAVDLEFDSLTRVGPTGTGFANALEVAAMAAVAAYARAHEGQQPTDPIQLTPYLPQPVDPAKLRPYLP